MINSRPAASNASCYFKDAKHCGFKIQAALFRSRRMQRGKNSYTPATLSTLGLQLTDFLIRPLVLKAAFVLAG